MTIAEALEIVRDQMFGLGTRDHGFLTRVNAMRVIQPILEAAAKVDKVESMATLSVLRNAVGPMSYRVYGAAEEIRALLAALPDKPREE